MTTPLDRLPSRSRRVADVVAVLLVFAIAAGFLSALVAWYRRTFPRDSLRTYMSPDMVWMSPIGHLAILAPVALLLVLLALLAPRVSMLWWSTLLLGVVSAFSVSLLFHPALALYAVAALSVGVGVQLAMLVRRDPARARRRFDRTAVALVVALIAAAGVRAVTRAQSERRLAGEFPAAAEGSPNVLLIILDTVRASNLSLYGYAWDTSPFLESLASEATVFDWAFAAAPWTLPSHASMFTGRYPSQAKADWDYPLDRDIPTLAESFRAKGYATGGFTANLVATPAGFGLARGFTRYEDFPFTLAQCVMSAPLAQAESLRDAGHRAFTMRWLGGALQSLAKLQFAGRYSYPDTDWKPAEGVIASFLRWRAAAGTRPYFAFLNLFDAHVPYHPPPAYRTLFREGNRSIDQYDRSIRYIDDQLASLRDSLEAHGELDRTVVVITSDHGEQFGEHGISWHGNSLYAQLTHVPLIVRFPSRVPSGTRVTRQVSLRDIAATIIDLTALPDTRLPGTSLATTWDSAPGAPSLAVSELSKVRHPGPYALNAKGDMHALSDDSLHYIRDGAGSISLFNYRTDPREERNLWRPELAGVAAAMDSAYRESVRRPDSTVAARTGGR